ncbi:MAG TPA: hypothetical protein ENJ33_06815 [Thiothrix sp.]|nr:hypothetical protein [Thiothrix sp.]
MKNFITLVSGFLFVISIVSAEPKVLVIDWPVTQKLKSSMTVLSARSMPYPSGLIDKANAVHLPVYLPSAYAYQETLQMVGEGDFYTVTVPLSAATVFITGDRTYQQDSNAVTSVSTLAKELSFIRAEGMVSVDFNRHGANYTLSIECDQPDDDQRCTQTRFLQQVYADLVLIGGQP